MTPTSVIGLHGFTRTARSFDPLRAQMGPKVHFFTPPMLGHAGSVESVEGSTFMAEVDRLAELIVQHTQKGRVLCGYSMGGRLALGLLGKYQALFSAALVIGAHPGLETEQDRKARRAQDSQWIALLENEGIEAFVARWEELPLLQHRRPLSASDLRTLHEARLSHQAAGLARCLRILGLAEMPNCTPNLRSLSIPATLMVGAHDHKFIALARKLAADLPGMRLAEIPHCGHDVLTENSHSVAEVLETYM